MNERRAEVATPVILADEALTGWYGAIRKARRPFQLESGYQKLIDTVQGLTEFPLINFSLPAITRFESLKKLMLNVSGNDLRAFARVLELKVEYWSL